MHKGPTARGAMHYITLMVLKVLKTNCSVLINPMFFKRI